QEGKGQRPEGIDRELPAGSHHDLRRRGRAAGKEEVGSESDPTRAARPCGARTTPSPAAIPPAEPAECRRQTTDSPGNPCDSPNNRAAGWSPCAPRGTPSIPAKTPPPAGTKHRP